MTATHKQRYCRCGTRLARDNTGTRCAPCLSHDRERLHAAPKFPPDFWDEVVLSEALQSRHMGRVIRAWRTHPYHGRHPISQDRVASWVGLTQAQLSRIENGPALAHLDRLVQWAEVLRVPADRLWFALPITANQPAEGEDRVKRRKLIAAAGATLATGLLGGASPGGALSNDRDAVERFAWDLWQHGAGELHRSQIPEGVRRHLDQHPHVMRTPDNTYRFTDPSLTDVLVAHRVFGDIAQGSGHLLATAQTSHAIDLTISALTADDEARRGLTAWMHRGPTAVLRVNSAGILAKVGSPDLSDAAISAIRGDDEARHLYLTAVASRVLEASWDEAAHLAASVDGRVDRRIAGLASGREAWAAERLTVELTNPRDAAARWCSALLLATLPNMAFGATRAAVMSAVPRETSRENLRAYAAVLAGTNPLMI
ncbi:helix-turn-helix domain-containing protein [Micromonospora sp. 4G55]|uniref:helix-turn-helix domain-containing protein n=1 Tax=Micromonospora sp. 4G55 TaxID=2806102 RepID=UPI001A3E4A0F|nr:helix-turn-helix transcriptional regulator [Micromonospora sp. 4G55]MBM0256496.1 helix-turn-helix transcriptional regulator [Micromonospora sp. 4G55]